jgi:hypothetical protein
MRMGSHDDQTAGGPRRAIERSRVSRRPLTDAAILKRLADRGIDEPLAGSNPTSGRGIDV